MLIGSGRTGAEPPDARPAGAETGGNALEPRDAFHALDRVELVDVREQWEWDAGHIEEARHVPLGELPARLDELPRERPVVVVCRSGARSADATEFLRAQGFDAHNLDGGVQLWTGEGLPYSGVVV